MKKAFLSAVIALVFCAWLTANASADVVFTADYAGSFSGSIVNPGPPIILFTSGTGTDPSAGLGLTNAALSHNTQIGSTLFDPQTIFNGSLTLTGGGGVLDASYTGTFQLNTADTMGTFHFDLTFGPGSGTVSYVTGGTGTADGTAILTTQFAGTFDAKVTADLTTAAAPLPGSTASVSAFFAIVAAMAFWRSVKQRQSQAAA